MKPIDQIQKFLIWFHHYGVEGFDIHVRKPKTSNEDYKTGNWIWLTKNENIVYKDIQKTLVSWLRCENAHGSDIYFRPHRNGIHPVIFLDDVSIDNALKVAMKYSACVVETSYNNTQIWLATDKPLDKSKRKKAQTLLMKKGYSDPGSISGDHLGRLCGVKSQKHDTWVNLIKTSTVKPYSIPMEDKSLFSSPLNVHDHNSKHEIKKLEQTVNYNMGVLCASKSCSYEGSDNSKSAKEWGWIMGMLRNGTCKNVVKQKLKNSAERRGKKNSERYATYTVEKAISIIR
jgi:hypothetical protein